MVDRAITNEAMAIMGGKAICKYLSPVLSACHAFIRTTIVPIRYGGVVRRSVVTLSFPRPDMTLHNKLGQHQGLSILRLERLTHIGKNVVTAPDAVHP